MARLSLEGGDGGFDMMLFGTLLLTSCSVWVIAGTRAVLHAAQRSPLERAPERAPGVTILKPLSGADPGLEENLETFFQQEYPLFELVFGVEDGSDPAVRVVRTLMARHPGVPCRLVVHGGTPGLNPKVRNLRGMVPEARYDLLLISDSNVRAPRHYLADLVNTMRSEDDVGLVTNLFSGTGENTLGSALENVQLNGFCAAGATLATTLGDTAVIGKSMLFSRATFEALGGFESVAHVLAEDYVMGKKFQHAGLKVRIAPTVLENVTTNTTLRGFLMRHHRWAMLRYRLRPLAFALEPLTSPLLLLPLAASLFGLSLALAWAASLLALRDVAQWIALRGLRRAWVPLLLSPLRELVLLPLLAVAPLSRHVSWRRHRVRLSAGTLAYACEVAEREPLEEAPCSA